jgi:hypothetical protein
LASGWLFFGPFLAAPFLFAPFFFAAARPFFFTRRFA